MDVCAYLESFGIQSVAKLEVNPSSDRVSFSACAGSSPAMQFQIWQALMRSCTQMQPC